MFGNSLCLWRFAWREGVVSKAWSGSISCRLFTAIINIPCAIVKALYKVGRPVWDASLFCRLLRALGGASFFFMGLFMMVMLMAPHSMWNNTYALLGAMALTALFIAGSASRRQYRLEQSTQIGDEEVVLADLYLSPISVAFTLQVQPNDPRLWGMTEFSDVMDTTVLTLADGGMVRAENAYGQSYDPTTGEARFVFRLGQITDPEQVTALSFLGQTFSLEGLEPAAD